MVLTDRQTNRHTHKLTTVVHAHRGLISEDVLLNHVHLATSKLLNAFQYSRLLASQVTIQVAVQGASK